MKENKSAGAVVTVSVYRDVFKILFDGGVVRYCAVSIIYEHEWNPEINVFYKRFIKYPNPCLYCVQQKRFFFSKFRILYLNTWVCLDLEAEVCNRDTSGSRKKYHPAFLRQNSIPVYFSRKDFIYLLFLCLNS